MARARAQPLVFRGAGRALSAALPEGWAGANELPTLEFDEPAAAGAQAQFVMLRGAAAPGLRVKLPPTTPSGTYKGALRLGKDTRPIVVEVAPNARLRLLPGEIALSAAPGGEVRTSVVAINRGNVEIELPRSPQLRFFASPGLDRCAGRLFEVRVPGLEPLFARTDELQPSDSAVAQVVLRKGAGALLPGDARTLDIAVRVDPAAAPGLRYFGEWSLAGGSFALILDVDPAGPAAQEIS